MPDILTLTSTYAKMQYTYTFFHNCASKFGEGTVCILFTVMHETLFKKSVFSQICAGLCDPDGLLKIYQCSV